CGDLERGEVQNENGRSLTHNPGYASLVVKRSALPDTELPPGHGCCGQSGMQQPVRYWRLGTTGGDRRHNYWPQMRTSHDIAMGWADLGDLRPIVDDASRLRRRVVEIRETSPYYRAQTNPERSIGYISDQARQFVRGIKVGDIV